MLRLNTLSTDKDTGEEPLQGRVPSDFISRSAPVRHTALTCARDDAKLAYLGLVLKR